MAATNEASTPELTRGWFQNQLTEVNQPFRRLLQNYSGIASSEVVSHVNTIREHGFKANPYPCIGLYRFTNLTLITHPLYPTIVDRLKRSNTTYLDIGCCFGQDLRQLVYDGVPSEHLIGIDIEQPLIELGYRLFLDRQKLNSQFIIADVFKGSSQGTWADLQARGIDVLHCSAFFHLFPLEQQLEAAIEIVSLMKVGGVIVGRQSGSVKPGNLPAMQDNLYSYRHDVSTLVDLWHEVGEITNTRWNVEGTLDMVGVNACNSAVENEDSRRLLFTITRVA
ncbi:hypothetical protein NPX13_g6912 [Xylaria arbuscula]|uniref:Methyltransferase domain-containing protein n=1 Tax=Xylaria arbuscula TaxID=114810 RepID=A0A9W8NBB5_9PEZI|nr:hypothetical protein NPX13_g6912 [Xylaria arbuscula]